MKVSVVFKKLIMLRLVGMEQVIRLAIFRLKFVMSLSNVITMPQKLGRNERGVR